VLSWLVETLAGTRGAVSYALVFAFVFADASLFMGFLLPGEAPAIVGGVLGGRRAASPWLMAATAAAGAAAGDCATYWIGRWLGEARAVRWGRRFGVTGERLERADGFLRAHGRMAVFGGRFASVLRAAVPLAAGVTGMRFARFLSASVPAAVVWASLFTGVGYAAGDNWQNVAHLADRGLLVGLLAVGLALGARALYRRRTRRGA
jgi:undecaprenyl-diphosphatase